MTGLSIAHVLPTFGMGGQERVALDLAVGQTARGHRVLGVSLGEGTQGPLADEFRAHGIDVATRTKWPQRRGIDLSLPARLAILFRRRGVQVVHTHNPQPLIYGAPAGKLAGCATVHTRHGENPDPPLRKVLRRLAGTLADAYVAVSEETAALASQEHDARLDKIRVIRNGIDLSRFDPMRPLRGEVRRELGIPDDAWVVGTVGRVVTEKHHELLVDAMKPLCDAGAHLVIVGDGALLPALRAKAGRNMHLLGVRRDAPRVMQSFDAFCMSSRSEGLPLVILEAMASALPIVSTAVGGIPNVVADDHTGVLVPPGDADALRAALSSLRADPTRAARLADAGRSLALAEYSADTMVDRYLALYEQLVVQSIRRC
jgi:glycosyltransferase involved in cell wall biosynthesis